MLFRSCSCFPVTIMVRRDGPDLAQATKGFLERYQPELDVERNFSPYGWLFHDENKNTVAILSATLREGHYREVAAYGGGVRRRYGVEYRLNAAGAEFARSLVNNSMVTVTSE